MSLPEEKLKNEFPDATKAECRRFARACHDGKKRPDAVMEEAKKLLGDYLEWRKCYGLDDNKADISDGVTGDWKMAIKKALGGSNANVDLNEASRDTNDMDARESHLLQFVFVHKSKDGVTMKDKNGRMVLHVLPAMMDSHAVKAEVVGHCVGIYLDQVFDRNSEEKVTVLLDARAGEGWPNPKIVTLASYIQTLSHIVQVNHPDRFHTFLIVPVPLFAIGVWTVVKRFLRPDIRDTFCLMKGPSGMDSPLPTKQLEEHVDGDVIESMELFRKLKFKPTNR